MGMEFQFGMMKKWWSWMMVMVVQQCEYTWDFPGGIVVKNPPANVGDMGSSPGPGRSHMPQSN